MFPFDALFVYFSILEFVPYKSTQYMQRLIIILALLLVESQATFLVFYFFFSNQIRLGDFVSANKKTSARLLVMY